MSTDRKIAFDPDDHMHNCDYVRRARQGLDDGECYCPTPGERATRPGCGHLVDACCDCDER